MTAPRRPAKPVPQQRTIEDVNRELDEKLALYAEERRVFERLLTLARNNNGAIDPDVQTLVRNRIAADEQAARSVAAEEMRRIIQQMARWPCVSPI